MEINKSEFVISAVSSTKYPESIDVEFAFVGRSNVGKSSLINSLTNRRGLAKTSKTPGKTQLINYFKINREFYFVDLPGYGFAKVPASVKQNWGAIIEEYLSSERKKLVFVLLDIRRIPSPDDKEMIGWLEHFKIDYRIIFTKTDKLSNNEKFNQLQALRKVINVDSEDVFFYSSLTKAGREKVLEFIGDYRNKNK